MNPDSAVDLLGMTVHQIVLLVCVLALPSLVVGLIVSTFQAATQINEQTLSFLPRLLVTLLTITLTGHWIITNLSDFCIAMFKRAAVLG